MEKIKKNIKKGRRLRSAKINNVAKKDDLVNDKLIEDDKIIETSQEMEQEPLIKEDAEPLENENLSGLTLAELAELARPYSNRSVETLKRLKREELLYIVINQKDDYKKSELSNLNQDTKDLIELSIEILNDIKIKRTGQPVNAILLKIYRNQDKKISEGFVKIGASGGIIGYSLCFFIILCVVIDAFFGFDAIFNRYKDKNKESDKKSNETQSNNNNYI